MAILNTTLLVHLPLEFRDPKNNREARVFAFRAQQNVRKRAELGHPEDILDATQLTDAVNDLLECSRVEISPLATQTFGFGIPGRFNEEHLLWQIRHGLISPRYLVRTYGKTGVPRGSLSGILPGSCLVFDDKGYLEDLVISRPDTKRCHSLGWYKKHDFLVDRPSPQEVLRAWPRQIVRKRRGQTELSVEGVAASGIILFVFAQVLQALKFYRLTFSTCNWLSTSPETYHRRRVEMFQQLQEYLQKTGAPPLRFCENALCQKILPIVGQQKKFCGDRCEWQVKNPKSWVRRKTKRDSALTEPLPVSSSRIPRLFEEYVYPPSKRG